jgi:hypothetical protein
LQLTSRDSKIFSMAMHRILPMSNEHVGHFLKARLL